MAESTVVTRTEIPDWLRTFQEDILTRAQGLGNQQIRMPEYEVAGRTPFQQQAANLSGCNNCWSGCRCYATGYTKLGTSSANGTGCLRWCIALSTTSL